MRSFDTTDTLFIEAYKADPVFGTGYWATWAILPTDIEVIMSKFPKSAGLKRTTLTRPINNDYLNGSETVPYISGYADFRKNGVNGGVNEAGIKRIRTLLKAAEKAGISVMYQATCTNSIPTLDDLLAGLG